MEPMELTPKVFRDVQFREKARGGYHPEDVDDFLEQAALAAEAHVNLLREATERAERAEKAASDAASGDEALKRMLLMGQRTVDQAIAEAREEADRLLAAARAQASALVADAEERGRRAYEDTLAETRAKMEAAAADLRQAEQEAEALSGWVDVNRSHLLAVLRDAHGLLENAGLLSEPPQASPINLPAVQAAPVGHADTAGPAPSEEVAEGYSYEEDNAPTGEWDARLLEDGGREQSAPEVQVTGDGVEAQSQVEGTNGLNPTPGPGAEAGEGLHSSPGDQTLAFDESALDSFFKEQDVGDERGLGRFRRRQ